MKSFLNIFYRKSRSDNDGIFCDKLAKLTGFKTKNAPLFKQAFTHSSTNKADENGNPLNYERLEFLGDAILGTVVASYLYQSVPQGNEGYLTKMRSKIVSRENLNKIGKKLCLTELVESKIYKNQFGDNIFGDLFEAFIGAIYIDKGFDYCESYIKTHILSQIEDINTLEGKITSHKSLFIEFCQKEKIAFRFESSEDHTNEHVRYFSSKLYYNERIIAKGRATSKKKAEEKAAQRAYFALQNKINVNIK